MVPPNILHAKLAALIPVILVQNMYLATVLKIKLEYLLLNVVPHVIHAKPNTLIVILVHPATQPLAPMDIRRPPAKYAHAAQHLVLVINVKQLLQAEEVQVAHGVMAELLTEAARIAMKIVKDLFQYVVVSKCHANQVLKPRIFVYCNMD